MTTKWKWITIPRVFYFEMEGKMRQAVQTLYDGFPGCNDKRGCILDVSVP